MFFKWYPIFSDIKIIISKFIRFNELFSMIFKSIYLFFSLICNCFYLFFKCFIEKRICNLSLFYYLSLIRRQYFFICKIFIFTNFSKWSYWYFCCFSVNIVLQFFISNLIINCYDHFFDHTLSKRFFPKRKGLCGFCRDW